MKKAPPQTPPQKLLNDLKNGYPDTFKNFAVNNLSGFKQWFILQHWSDLEASIHPKPFITMIQFEETFSVSL